MSPPCSNIEAEAMVVWLMIPDNYLYIRYTDHGLI